jgi:hypothetical protein
VTPARFVGAIRVRSLLLSAFAGLSRQEAERQAIRALRQEGHCIEVEPDEPARTVPRSAGEAVREMLVSQFMKLLARMERENGGATDDAPPSVNEPRPRPASRVPVVKKAAQYAPEPEPIAEQIVGVYTGQTTGAVRIDHEFEPRGVFDETTRSWRASIENARVVEESRREVWSRRLEERHLKGL